MEAGVETFKERNNLLGYDDLVENLHRALVRADNHPLAALLQVKYKAVFVDEFQDTDRQQFEIFDRAFSKNTILFYIGDPKQSIYAWRKADIFTYFKARSGVQQVYGMNHNYRSSAPLIDAMNTFFQPGKDFDTFYFDKKEEAIRYIPVNSPEPNTKGLLLQGKDTEAAISVFKLSNKEELVSAAAAQTALLLHKDSYKIEKSGAGRAVVPSDIGILVRTGQQGRDMKAALARLGIPAVTIDDAESVAIGRSRLPAVPGGGDGGPGPLVHQPRFTVAVYRSWHTSAILMLNDEEVLERFSRYKNRWQEDGIYTALMDFVADFGVGHLLLQGHSENGERIITNLFQLAELVHQAESRKKLSMIELISWLRRGIDGLQTEGDEYMQRVESDEDAVKIMTIHKSKGLEYNIVLVPFLDFVDRRPAGVFEFSRPGER